MKNLKAYSTLVSIMFLAGCVLSLEPFYTKESVIEMPALNGKWQPADNKGNPEKNEEPWVFDDDKILTFDKGDSGLLHVTYFSIGGLIFADTTVHKLQGINEWQAIHLMPVHMVSRIEVEGNQLTVRPLNINWFDDFIQEHPFANSVEIDEYNTLMVNASSQDWVNFLKKYGADKGAFSENGAFEFIRQIAE